jgi:HicB family
MQLDDYVNQVNAQLRAAATLADERTQEIAAGLSGAAAPAVRLSIMSALSAAADEITAALLDSPGAPGVAVRLDGEEIRVDVTGGESDPGPASRPDENDTTARISLRLPESLKTDIDAAATSEGISVNTWLVRAASTALSPGWGRWPGPGSPGGSRHGGNSHRVTGWISG